jgi:hypothetical protein
MRASTLAALLAAGLLAACADDGGVQTSGTSRCFPVDRDDLYTWAGGDFGGRQIVCGLNTVMPGAHEKYRERYPDRIPPEDTGRIRADH